MRKSFNAEFKAKVALKAIKEESTIAGLSSKYEVYRAQITHWRKRAFGGVKDVFNGETGKGKQGQREVG